MRPHEIQLPKSICEPEPVCELADRRMADAYHGTALLRAVQQLIAQEPSAGDGLLPMRWRTRILGGLLFVALLFRGHVTMSRSPPTPFQQCHGNSPILIGTHHKTGTVLLRHILYEVCPLLQWRCSIDNKPSACISPEQARLGGMHLCFLQHGIRFKVQGSTTPFRFVHVVRDPLEVVLSGYQYHLRTTERWALRPDKRYNGTSYRAHLNSLRARDGLRAELKHSLKDALKTMPRLLNRTSASPCTLTVRLEDFERDWRGTTARLWDLFGVEDAAVAERLDRAIAKHNVYQSDRPRYYNKHVANANVSSRSAMRRLLRDTPDIYSKIQDVRRRLGCALPPPIAPLPPHPSESDAQKLRIACPACPLGSPVCIAARPTSHPTVHAAALCTWRLGPRRTAAHAATNSTLLPLSTPSLSPPSRADPSVGRESQIGN